MTIHPLDDVRGLHEEFKGDWTTIVREHLNRTLVGKGYVSADDFDALGIPPEHSNLANAQMGAYSRMGFMEKVSWRRSTKPSRKSGTIWTHRITEKGRTELTKLVGIEGKGNEGPAPLDPGENSGAGVLSSQESGGPPVPSRDCASTGAPEDEVLTLFPVAA
jgi:hypothetical protein